MAQNPAELSEVWRRFRQQLEVVRIHLSLDEELAEEELRTERQHLLCRQVTNDQGPRRTSDENDSQDWRDIAGWGRALLMYQDQLIPEVVSRNAVLFESDLNQNSLQ